MRIYKDALIDAMLEKASHFNNMRNATITPAMREHYEELTVIFGALTHEFAKEHNYMILSQMVDNHRADISKK